ncbi:MAG: hypothetical protein WAL91_10120 [Propionicimonas sp.]
MTSKVRAFVMALILVTGLLTALAPPAAAGNSDWVSVTRIEVNRLGGVTVRGQVSCAGAYQQLVAGNLSYQDENEAWHPIPPLLPGDEVNLFANSDNYTVTQPAGRKTMITATHESSRMNPCYLESSTLMGGITPPYSVACEADGTPCRWETDAYGYDRESNGPLFDYAPNGKFNPGLMSVTVRSIGLLVEIRHADGSWSDYFGEEDSYAMTSRTIKAVSYR